MQKLKRMLQDDSSGEIMLESTFVMLFTLFVIIAIISVGFLFYQQTIVNIAANDVAARIAASEKYNEDGISEDLGMYRTSLLIGSTKKALSAKAKEMINERMPLVSLGINDSNTVPECELVVDDIGRMHVEVTISTECDILFGESLVYFGILDGKPKFTATGRAEYIDITAYAGQVNFVNYLGAKAGSNKLTSGVLAPICEVIDNAKRVFEGVKSLFS